MCCDLNSINVQSQAEYRYLTAIAELSEDGAIVTANAVTLAMKNKILQNRLYSNVC